MKTNIPAVLLLVYLLTVSNAFAQQWTWLNPKPSGLTGTSITFVNPESGFIVNGSEVLRTQDAGVSWVIQQSLRGGNDIKFNDDTGVIAGNRGAVYISANKGDSWEEVTLNTTENLNAVSIPHPDTIYITGNRNLFRSYDGGLNWSSLPIQAPGASSLTITKSFFTNSNTGHAVSNRGAILKTIDRGQTWYVTESTNTIPSNFFSILFVTNDVGYASRAHHTVFKTVDGGESWRALPTTYDAMYGMYFLNEFIGYSVGDHGTIYKTVNGGQTWEWSGLQGGRIDGTSLFGVYFTDEQVGYAVGQRGRILKTLDGGSTWSGYGLTYYDIRDLDFPSDETGYALSSEMYKSSDKGETWSVLTTGLNEEEYSYTKGQFLSADTGFVVASHYYIGSQDDDTMLKTTDGGNSWTKVLSIYRGSISAFYFLNYSTGYYSISGGGFCRTQDGGKTWKVSSPVGTMSKIHFVDANTGFALRYGDLYQTTDGGVNWRKTYEVYGEFTDISFVNQRVGYISAEHGMVLKTEDGGASWQELRVGSDHYMAVAFFNENTGLVAGQYGSNFSTADGGITWQPVAIPAPVTKLNITKDKTVFAAGANGKILRSTLPVDEFILKAISATEIVAMGATLTGVVASNGEEVSHIQFEYGTSGSFDSVATVTPGSVGPNSSVQIKHEVNNLQPNTTYRFRIRATYQGTEHVSQPVEFKTQPEFVIMLGNAQAITSNSAILNGLVVSNHQDITNIRFEYGTNQSFEQHLDASPASVLKQTQATVTASLLQLQPATTYHVRLRITHQGEEFYTGIRTFTTRPELIINISTSLINASQVRLSATVESHIGSLNDIVFEYGKTKNFSSEAVASPNAVEEGVQRYIQASITDLDSEDIYFCRVKAIQGDKDIYSTVSMFRTSGGVLIEDMAAEQLNGTQVKLTGLIAPQGNNINKIQFEYGESEAYGQTLDVVQSYVPPYGTRIVEAIAKDLLPNRLYHFRTKCIVPESVYYSADHTFTTASLTSLADDSEQRITLYPNPSHGKFSISSQANIQRIEVYDQIGKLVLEETPNSKTFDLNLVNQVQGMYILRIQDNKQTTTKKILKL